jgi:3-hydroxyisobutyrate dehydrogenase-like beta-hydroxyacid dehydrogenase
VAEDAEDTEENPVDSRLDAARDDLSAVEGSKGRIEPPRPPWELRRGSIVHHPPSIGFIGFGEAGSTIAGGLRSAGIDRLAAFDINTDTPVLGPLIRQRAAQSQTVLVESSAALTQSSDILLSTVTSSAALDAATETAPFLEPRHVYADLNSVSPARKQEIAQVVAATGAQFVEVAVMAPVLPYGHRVPMLLGGRAAPLFEEAMRPFGLCMETLDAAPIGAAAAVKMCRSIIVKGLEALMCECVIAASRFEADRHVFASLNESFPGIDWMALADYMVGRVVVHGERRAREMEEVAETLRAIGVEPIMAEAAARRQDWSARLELRSHFGPEGPKTYREVLDVIRSMTHA